MTTYALLHTIFFFFVYAFLGWCVEVAYAAITTRELVNRGHVYIGMPPLYKVYKKDVVEYAYDDAELQDAIKRVGKGYQIQRYKGLGEMDPAQLWETTMDPSTRSMMQVTVEDAAEVERMITVLMGDQLEERKRYIAEHANFNKEDTFIKEVKL